MTSRRLSLRERARISAAMRLIPFFSIPLAIGLAAPSLAQTRLAAKPAVPAHPSASPAARPAGPKAIGRFEDWTAATNSEAGQTVCYAFTRAQSSAPAIPGRGDVVLTVTERTSGHDAVALSAGFAYAANSAVPVQIDSASVEFYTAQRSAFSRDGHATVLAFQKAQKIVARSPAPRGATVADTFSLRGFNAAYAAIVKACPPK